MDMYGEYFHPPDHDRDEPQELSCMKAIFEAFVFTATP